MRQIYIAALAHLKWREEHCKDTASKRMEPHLKMERAYWMQERYKAEYKFYKITKRMNRGA